MADPFAPYAGIEGAALTGGEGGDLLQKLLLGVLQGTAQIPQHVIDAARNTAPPGLRREDYTDIPAPGGLTQAWQPGDAQRAGAVDAAMLTMGATPFGMAAPRVGETVLGAGPIRTTAYKAMEGDAPYLNPDIGMTHVALDRSVAEQFSQGRKVHDVTVDAKKPFDFRDPSDLQWLAKEMEKPENVAAYNRDTKKIMGPDYEHVADARFIKGGLEEGLYQAYEVPAVSNLIKSRGYDGIYMAEAQGSPVNLAVFHPSQIEMNSGKVGALPSKPSLEEMFAESKRQIAAAEDLAKEAAASGKMVFEKGGKKVAISPSLNPEYKHRVTNFDDKGPVGHREYKANDFWGLESEIRMLLGSGFKVKR